MKKALKIKDVLLIALLTAIYIIMYFISMAISIPLGAYGHVISTGFDGLLGGPVLFFISRKIGKFLQFTIMTIFMLGVFSIMGGGYLPWLITSLTGALIADFIASHSKQVSVIKLSIASGILHVGIAAGGILPAMFFAQSFKDNWVKRGQSAAQMDEMIKYSTGVYGIGAILIVFILSIVGIYIGNLILRKHFKEA